MPSPFYLAIANPPARKGSRRKKRRTMTALQRRYFGKRKKTSKATRRPKSAQTARTAQEAPQMARKMTAKQRKYFGKKKSTTNSTGTTKRAKHRGFTHGRRGFMNTGAAVSIAKQSAIGAAGFIAGSIATDKVLEMLGRDKPETPADHFSKKPATAAGVKFGLALVAYMAGKKFAPKYAAAFAAGVGTSAAVDVYAMVQAKNPSLPGIKGLAGQYPDGDNVTNWAPSRLTA